MQKAELKELIKKKQVTLIEDELCDDDGRYRWELSEAILYFS